MFWVIAGSVAGTVAALRFGFPLYWVTVLRQQEYPWNWRLLLSGRRYFEWYYSRIFSYERRDYVLTRKGVTLVDEGEQ